ncbi:MAG TPA: RpiB/LacA/LacB family sugar-phosphate isomerase [Candidatus Saccharimonadia bacterium]|jgi:ribose 5-phosphate isomerase B
MKIFLGADHAGYELKNQLKEHLIHNGYEVEDVGAKTLDDDDDYPRYAYALAAKILGADEDDRGVLICGSGQGMSMAANRVNGVRAALAWNADSAKAARADDNSNVLVLPARFVAEEAALDMVDAWLATEFKSDPKYLRRLDELEELYG